MPDQVLALYGQGKGPRVPIHNKKAVARIAGKIDEGSVVYHVEKAGTVESVEFNQVGDHPLPDGEFVSVEHVGKSKALLCFVRM